MGPRGRRPWCDCCCCCLSATATAAANPDVPAAHPLLLPSLQEFGWGHEVAGIIQSTFYAGFVVLQLPVGFMASTIGGRRVLPIGLSTWSLATALVPVMASSLPTLAFCRYVKEVWKNVAQAGVAAACISGV